jgi:hypothetical protein
MFSRRLAAAGVVVVAALFAASTYAIVRPEIAVPFGGLTSGTTLQIKHPHCRKVIPSVTPRVALIDAPTAFVVRCLNPGEKVQLTLKAIDANPAGPVTWTSQTWYQANASGTVDVSSAKSLPGSDFPGLVDAAMPFDALQPPSVQCGVLSYTWKGDVSTPSTQSYPYTYTWKNPNYSVFYLQVLSGNGTVLASESIFRADVARGETRTVLAGNEGSNENFYGEYFAPGKIVVPKPAVLMFGGSEGGLSSLLQRAGSLLAAHGIPTLVVAYFGNTCNTVGSLMPGSSFVPGSSLPSSLYHIPLEYFQGADNWLAAQHGVDPNRIFVSGTSRGSEAALLLAYVTPYVSKYGDQPYHVDGVIANVPDDVIPDAAWFLGGTTVNEGQEIPVSGISQPLFLDCGGADATWPSCAHVMDIETERANPSQDAVAQCPTAGHGVAALVPYLPYEFVGSDLPLVDGASPLINQIDDATLWPKLIGFIRSSVSGPVPC